ncbi:hypothetical protein [Streptomyces sp. NPDC056244]|uniref:hypothetical protein n=1 Tax=Streptomyces sp. NPDC056244 TaxID=3345762 RepID=UPI0035E20D0F
MKKTTGALVALCAAGPLLMAVPVLAIGSATASAFCSVGGAQAVDTAAVAAQVKAILDGGTKGAVFVAGLDDPADQIPNAKTIQATDVAMNIPARGQVVTLATALQESGLRNLAYGDRDSLGLFQQRPSQGWGTANEILDPVHASTMFYEALERVSGWQSLSVTQAAQAVQKSGLPEAYAAWEPLATALQKAIEPLLAQAGGASSGPAPSGSAGIETPVPGTAGGCTAGGDGTDFGIIPPGAGPSPRRPDSPLRSAGSSPTALASGPPSSLGRAIGASPSWGPGSARATIAPTLPKVGRNTWSDRKRKRQRHGASLPASMALCFRKPRHDLNLPGGNAGCGLVGM